MPIGPSQAIPLLEVYEDLIAGAEDLTSAAAKIAPAAVREVLCVAGNVAGLLGGPLGSYGAPGSFPRGASDLGGILRAACPVPPPLPTGSLPPFAGGQCPCVPYFVSGTYQVNNNAPVPFSFGGQPGPIVPFYGRPGPITGTSVWGFSRGSTASGCPQSDFNVIQTGSNNTVKFSLTVTPGAGNPDNCGDLPNPGVPDGPIIQPPDSPEIPTVRPDGNPGNPVIFRPRVGPVYFGPEGGVYIPVTVNVDGPEFNIGGPEFNIPISIPVAVSLPDFKPTFVNGGGGGGDLPSNPSPPAPPYVPCCNPPPPIEAPAPEGEPPVEDDPPAPRKKLIGATVFTTRTGEASRATEYYAAEPEIYVPRVATLQFYLQLGTRVALSLPVEIKGLRQYVQAPTEGRVLRAVCTWEKGFQGSVSNVFQ